MVIYLKGNAIKKSGFGEKSLGICGEY